MTRTAGRPPTRADGLTNQNATDEAGPAVDGSGTGSGAKTSHIPGLAVHHHRELSMNSAISDEVIRERGYTSTTRYGSAAAETRARLKRLGMPKWCRDEDPRLNGLLIPVYRPTGERVSFAYRMDSPPRDPDTGKPRRYAWQAGQASRLDVHPRNRDRIADPTVPVWITEGIKKADALTTVDQCVIALAGVFNWRSRHGTLGDWEDVPLRGRRVLVCFDSDTTTNANVARAMDRLGKWLESKGAHPLYIVVPAKVATTDTKGVDDYLAAGGQLTDLLTAATKAPPEPPKRTVMLSDAALTEDVVEEALGGYRWAKGLGWMRWDGRRWDRTPDEDTREQVRIWVLDKYRQAGDAVTAALAAGDMVKARQLADARDAWFGYLNRSRIEALTVLARGTAKVKADVFDAHPDVLNTATGVVDLRTGALMPHDPDLFLTKITPAGYTPGATHADWDTALSAIPADCRDWYQARCGQAITGHMTPDDVLILQQGGGENGKTTLTEGIKRALGDDGYFVSIAHRALIADPDAHPTELMDFRGARFALLEELPEGRRLSIVRLKQAVGTPTIKARHIRQDSVTFDATHSLFLSTNYKPIIAETDHGTWRRLALLTFPYRFRKPTEPLEAPTDRRGDPGLRDRVKFGEDGQHAAVLAWLVEGARRWYAADKVMPPLPERVDRDTRKWRANADAIISFCAERVAFDPGAHVMSSELFTEFTEWMDSKDHRAWAEPTFTARFEGHEIVASHRVSKKRVRPGQASAGRLDRRPALIATPPPAGQYTAWLGVRFRAVADDQEDGGNGAEADPTGPRVQGVQGAPHDVPFHAEAERYRSVPAHPAHGAETAGQSPDGPREPGPDYCPDCAADVPSTQWTGCSQCSTGRAHRYGPNGHGPRCYHCRTTTEGTAA